MVQRAICRTLLPLILGSQRGGPWSPGALKFLLWSPEPDHFTAWSPDAFWLWSLEPRDILFQVSNHVNYSLQQRTFLFPTLLIAFFKLLSFQSLPQGDTTNLTVTSKWLNF